MFLMRNKFSLKRCRSSTITQNSADMHVFETTFICFNLRKILYVHYKQYKHILVILVILVKRIKNKVLYIND